MVIFTKTVNLGKQNKKIGRYLTFLNPIKRTLHMVSSLQVKNKFKMAQVLSLFCLNITVSTTLLKIIFLHHSYFPHTCKTIQDTISNYLTIFLWVYFWPSLPIRNHGSPNLNPSSTATLPMAVSGSAGRSRGTGSEHLFNNRCMCSPQQSWLSQGD